MSHDMAAMMENFRHVWRLYAFDELLAKLAPIVAMTPKERDWLLRHHSGGTVTDQEEIRSRDAMDDLLGGCSILEIGLLSGALFVPGDHFAKLVPILRLPESRAYYEKRYPLTLPTQFLWRIELDCTTVHARPRSAAWFANLLTLNANFRDERLTKFLRIVDGFWIGGFNFFLLKLEVRKRQAVLDAVTTPRENRTLPQEVIAGLERFLFFCGDLSKLLDQVAHDIVLQNATFELYRYWFEVRGDALLEIAHATLAHLRNLDNLGHEGDLPDLTALRRLFARARLPRARLKIFVSSVEANDILALANYEIVGSAAQNGLLIGKPTRVADVTETHYEVKAELAIDTLPSALASHVIAHWLAASADGDSSPERLSVGLCTGGAKNIVALIRTDESSLLKAVQAAFVPAPSK